MTRAPTSGKSTTPSLGGELSRLRDEMNRTLDRFFAEPLGPTALDAEKHGDREGAPAIVVNETETELTIRAEVPGIPMKNVQVSVAGSLLTISGGKTESSEHKKDGCCGCGRNCRSLRRVVSLPDTVDTGKVTAEGGDGVVIVRIAKKPGAEPRRIEIRPSGKQVTVAGE